MESKLLLTHLEEIRAKAMDAYREILLTTPKATAELVKRKFFGFDASIKSLMELIKYHNTQMEGKLAEGTLKNYRSTARYVTKFLKSTKRREDIYLSELNFQFLLEFEKFVRTTPLKDFDPCHNNGLMKHIERLRKLTRLATQIGWLHKDPFSNYRLSFQKFDRQFLNDKELNTVELCLLQDNMLEITRDLFVFSCYTGLAPIDLSKLRKENIVHGSNGALWIHAEREKTGTAVNVPLLPKALAIMKKYENNPIAMRRGTLFPVMTNQQLNRSLKIIAQLCKIDKFLTFYLSRHTFATTVTLNNGVPLETVSKMLGHTKFSTTQIYARVLNKKIGEDMDALQKRLILRE